MSRLARLAVTFSLVLTVSLPSLVDAQAKKSQFKKDLEKREAGNAGTPQGSADDGAKPGKKPTKAAGKKKEVSRKIAAKKRKPAASELSLLEQSLVEHALSANEVDKLVGKELTLLMNDGKRLEGVKVAKFVKGKDPARIKILVAEAEGTSEKAKTKNYNCKTIYHIEVDKKVYDVRMLPSQKAYALVDVERRTEAIKAQLDAAGFKLWDSLSNEKLEKYVEEEKKFLDEVREHFTDVNLQLHESKYFLFLTDMPPNQIGPYVVHLDAMNERLGEAFGFVPGENIWRGKAVVITFVDRENFDEFESHFMKVQAGASVVALCHQQENGRVIVGAVRGDDPTDFGAVLVHETAHGYVHRYQSNKPIPKWLNEGIADWVANLAVPNSQIIKDHHDAALAHVQQTGNLGGMFNNQSPEAWQYGVAAVIVDQLIQADPDAFRLFFDGIKDGLLWEDSLTRAYGATREDLIAMYANYAGVEELQP